jgi:hypothetical protein
MPPSLFYGLLSLLLMSPMSQSASAVRRARRASLSAPLSQSADGDLELDVDCTGASHRELLPAIKYTSGKSQSPRSVAAHACRLVAASHEGIAAASVSAAYLAARPQIVFMVRHSLAASAQQPAASYAGALIVLPVPGGATLFDEAAAAASGRPSFGVSVASLPCGAACGGLAQSSPVGRRVRLAVPAALAAALARRDANFALPAPAAASVDRPGVAWRTLAGLASRADGERLVAALSPPEAKCAAYTPPQLDALAALAHLPCHNAPRMAACLRYADAGGQPGGAAGCTRAAGAADALFALRRGGLHALTSLAAAAAAALAGGAPPSDYVRGYLDVQPRVGGPGVACRAALDAVVADAADAARAKRACETFVARALAPTAPCAAPLAVPPALAVDNCNIPDEAGKQAAKKAWLNKIIDDALSVARHVPPAISLY